MLSEFAKVFERKVWRVQGAHLHNAARTLSSLSRCFQLSTNLLSLSLILSFSVALVEFHWLGINWHIFLPIRMQKLLLIYYYSENHATSRIWKVLPNMVFPPIGGKTAAFWACACKLSWTLFSPARVQPLWWGWRKGESRDWTTNRIDQTVILKKIYSQCYDVVCQFPLREERVKQDISNKDLIYTVQFVLSKWKSPNPNELSWLLKQCGNFSRYHFFEAKHMCW